MTWLTQYNDPALVVARDDTVASLTAAEVERLARELAVVKHAHAMPRRLGPDASAEDLAADKRRARRVLHVLEQCLGVWAGKKRIKLPSDEGIQATGAGLVWDNWWGSYRLHLEQRVVYIVSWCFQTDGDAKWTRSAVVRLQNEQRWIEYALR